MAEALAFRFDCVDCKCRVILFGWRPGQLERCATCLWISEFVPTDEQPAIRERLGVPLHG